VMSSNLLLEISCSLTAFAMRLGEERVGSGPRKPGEETKGHWAPCGPPGTTYVQVVFYNIGQQGTGAGAGGYFCRWRGGSGLCLQTVPSPFFSRGAYQCKHGTCPLGAAVSEPQPVCFHPLSQLPTRPGAQHPHSLAQSKHFPRACGTRVPGSEWLTGGLVPASKRAQPTISVKSLWGPGELTGKTRGHGFVPQHPVLTPWPLRAVLPSLRNTLQLKGDRA
jgi:hypothetical protein